MGECGELKEGETQKGVYPLWWLPKLGSFHVD